MVGVDVASMLQTKELQENKNEEQLKSDILRGGNSSGILYQPDAKSAPTRVNEDGERPQVLRVQDLARCQHCLTPTLL